MRPRFQVIGNMTWTRIILCMTYLHNVKIIYK